MSKGDGHRIAESLSAKVVKLMECSRWSELQQTVEYHAQMSAILKAPTVFRLLNDPGRVVGPQQFSVAERGGEFLQDDISMALRTMTNASPSGCTPLSQHIVEIRENIMAMLPQLQSTGQKVAIILATDGLPSDDYGVSDSSTRLEFESNLRSLAGLPVWVVVRLCTDEDEVAEYYNNLDSHLELSLEVLDDWVGEAQEIHGTNPWLNYGLCLHRMREMGFHNRLFDLLDERPLNLSELKEFFTFLFGPEAFDGAPDPSLDFNAFIHHVKAVSSQAGQLWNPVSKRMGPWIDVKKLKSIYADKCCVM
jgi:hypothetical protein